MLLPIALRRDERPQDDERGLLRAATSGEQKHEPKTHTEKRPQNNEQTTTTAADAKLAWTQQLAANRQLKLENCRLAASCCGSFPCCSGACPLLIIRDPLSALHSAQSQLTSSRVNSDLQRSNRRRSQLLQSGFDSFLRCHRRLTIWSSRSAPPQAAVGSTESIAGTRDGSVFSARHFGDSVPRAELT